MGGGAFYNKSKRTILKYECVSSPVFAVCAVCGSRGPVVRGTFSNRLWDARRRDLRGSVLSLKAMQQNVNNGHMVLQLENFVLCEMKCQH